MNLNSKTDELAISIFLFDEFYLSASKMRLNPHILIEYSIKST